MLEGCHQVVYEWHLNKTLKRFLHTFKGFAKDEESVEFNKAMNKMVNNFNQSVMHNLNLSVDKDDTEELPEVVPEEWTSEVLKLEQKCIAEEETKKEKKKKIAEEEKEGEPPTKFILKSLTEAFADLNNLKKFESMGLNTKRKEHLLCII